MDGAAQRWREPVGEAGRATGQFPVRRALLCRTSRRRPALGAAGNGDVAVSEKRLSRGAFMADEPKKSATELAAIRTRMASLRSVQAANRTLMAWIRTALSCFTFGFTIYKVFEGFEETGKALPHPDTPRNAGLFLSGLGIFAIVAGLFEYWQTIRDVHRMRHGAHPSKVTLRHMAFRFIRTQSIVFMAVIMLLAGLFIVFGIFAKIL